MCDTLVASGRAVADGATLLAKNSDREPNEAQVLTYAPAAEHNSGARLRCTYLEIPQARQTHAVLLSRPFWMWGAEMGVNARGVHIDLRHEGGSQPKWDSGASVFSDTTASDRWRVQIALPLERLVPDGAQPGQTLYFNVLRATNGQSALAWIPTFAGFHEPRRFGEITLEK